MFLNLEDICINLKAIHHALYRDGIILYVPNDVFPWGKGINEPGYEEILDVGDQFTAYFLGPSHPKTAKVIEYYSRMYL